MRIQRKKPAARRTANRSQRQTALLGYSGPGPAPPELGSQLLARGQWRKCEQAGQPVWDSAGNPALQVQWYRTQNRKTIKKSQAPGERERRQRGRLVQSSRRKADAEGANRRRFCQPWCETHIALWHKRLHARSRKSHGRALSVEGRTRLPAARASRHRVRGSRRLPTGAQSRKPLPHCSSSRCGLLRFPQSCRPAEHETAVRKRFRSGGCPSSFRSPRGAGRMLG
jgi:hypothetical protein